MTNLLSQITQKKSQLDSFQPLPPELVKNLEAWFRVELTYTSNALEGNTLSRQETALVVERGITVEGKTLREHLEAVNHSEAFTFVIEKLIPKPRTTLTPSDILDIHHLILQKIDEANAGRFRTTAVKIAGSDVQLPNATKVPERMTEYMEWLTGELNLHPAMLAAEAHLKLVAIHPFTDGNGRTARLLMNLLLMQAGYPPAIIRTEDRKRYITSIEQSILSGAKTEYYKVIYKAIDRSLDVYLEALQSDSRSAPSPTPQHPTLLKIGELAKKTGETIHTLRYWTTLGLLTAATTSPGGYLLYAPPQIDRVRRIRRLQLQKRLSLTEIKTLLKRIA